MLKKSGSPCSETKIALNTNTHTVVSVNRCFMCGVEMVRTYKTRHFMFSGDVKISAVAAHLLCDENIRALDVPVNDALVVQVAHPQHDLHAPTSRSIRQGEQATLLRRPRFQICPHQAYLGSLVPYSLTALVEETVFSGFRTIHRNNKVVPKVKVQV